jgi:non-ribosomal peptide synthetase component F
MALLRYIFCCCVAQCCPVIVSHPRCISVFGLDVQLIGQATVIATFIECSASAPFVTIGRPLPNYFLYVFDPATSELCPLGVAGELCIGGVALSRGYVGRKDLTAEKFIDNPFRRPAAQGSLSDAQVCTKITRLTRYYQPYMWCISHQRIVHCIALCLQALTALNLPAPGFLRCGGDLGPEAPVHDAAADPPLLYRTGDLCKWTEDGNLEFLGRIDAQV